MDTYGLGAARAARRGGRVEGENGSGGILLGAGPGICGRSGGERFGAVDGAEDGREGREMEQNSEEGGNVAVGAGLAVWDATAIGVGRQGAGVFWGVSAPGEFVDEGSGGEVVDVGRVNPC